MSETIGNGFLPSDLSTDELVSGDRTVEGNLTVLGSATIPNIALPPIYTDNASAIADGLITGDLYRTNADPDVLCVVHDAPVVP